MTLLLRDYQQELKDGLYREWRAGARNVLGVLPCGGGKTAVFSNIIAEHDCASVAIAHRSELVSQMSVALARNGVRHRVIGPGALVRNIVQCHLLTVGRNYYDAGARCAVASVQTLTSRDANDPWYRNVGLWVTDEVHHLLKDNQWGTAVSMFPNARGLGVTATPLRADGKGLGRHAEGLIDSMVVGPGMRELIGMGYLSDYRIYAPATQIDLTAVPVTAAGDFSPEPLRAAVHRSQIVGDVVATYLKLTPGKLGLTFAVDVESATELAAAYRAAGVPAEVLTGKTPANIRYKLLGMFARGEIRQLCTVDIISEGFDLPSVEVGSFARPTQSYQLFVQQFGRMCRPLEGKTHAYILDHVSNVLRHGLPDAAREWSLDRRQRRASNATETTIPIRICPACTGAYERVRTSCPYCGHTPEPAGRSTPAEVDGDLMEMTPEALARLRGEIEVSEQLRIPYGAAPPVEGALRKHHRERLAAQAVLRARMAQYGGYWTSRGDTLQMAQRRFYLTYGVDVATAQTLNAREATELMERIRI